MSPHLISFLYNTVIPVLGQLTFCHKNMVVKTHLRQVASLVWRWSTILQSKVGCSAKNVWWLKTDGLLFQCPLKTCLLCTCSFTLSCLSKEIYVRFTWLIQLSCFFSGLCQSQVPSPYNSCRTCRRISQIWWAECPLWIHTSWMEIAFRMEA